jgi:hypothetical protein
MLRIIEADDEDLDLLTSPIPGAPASAYRYIRDAQAPVSLRNEARCMLSLRALCEECLGQYPTTLEADCARLTSGAVAPFSNERHALIQVKGEKEVLLFFRDFADTAARLLQMRDTRELEAAVEDVLTHKHPVLQQYVTGTVLRLRQEEQRRVGLRQRTLDFSKPTVV